MADPVMEPQPTPEPIVGVRDIVLVASGKGGVGKSTVAINLAVALAAAGRRTGIVDLDLSGPSIARLAGAGLPPGVDPQGRAIPRRAHGVSLVSVADFVPPEQAVAWKGPLVAQAVRQLLREVAWPDLDVLVADMPPGTGDVLLTVIDEIPVTGVVVVTTPERMATVDAERAVSLFHQHDIPVFGIVRNLAEFICPCCGERQPLFGAAESGGIAGGADVARRMHVADMGAIPADMAAPARVAAGVPVAAGEPESPAGRAYARIAAAVEAAIARERAGGAQRAAAGWSIWELDDED